jgi:hypothetical protein
MGFHVNPFMHKTNNKKSKFLIVIIKVRTISLYQYQVKTQMILFFLLRGKSK